MRRLIVLPAVMELLRPVWTDHFNELFGLLAERYGFRLSYPRSLREAEGADVLMLFANAHGRGLLRQAAHISRKTKLIVYMAGPHNFAYRGNFTPAIERADFIISGSGQLFLENWPDAAPKFRYFPNFFAPRDRYFWLSFNTLPKMNCLLTGHTSPKVYPMRARIKQLAAAKKNGMIVMRHPRWKGKGPLKDYELAPRLNEEYAKTLNEYFCAISTGSCHKYALAKCFEIPAAGSLLLAEPVQDLLDAGMVPNEHFIPIDLKTVIEKVGQCLECPEEFEHIRWAGMVHARFHHSVDNRAKEFKEVLDEL